jgi:hypothetical protein
VTKVTNGTAMGTSTSTPARLAAALAARLDAIVPDSLHVVADGVALIGPAGSTTYLDWPFDDRDFEEAVATAAERALDHVQDAIAEATTEPWPSREMPSAFAVIANEQLRCGYGDARTPHLELAPIPLRELRV